MMSSPGGGSTWEYREGRMEGLVKALPDAAKSPYALVAYVTAIICFLAAGSRLKELREVRRILRDENQRGSKRQPELKRIIASVISRPIPPKMTAEEYLASQRQSAILTVALTALLLAASLTVIAIVGYSLSDLYVNCQRRAAVYVEDTLQGESPRHIKLRSGSYAVTCKSEDGVVTTARADVNSGESSRIDVAKPLPTSSPPVPVLPPDHDFTIPPSNDVSKPRVDNSSTHTGRRGSDGIEPGNPESEVSSTEDRKTREDLEKQAATGRASVLLNAAPKRRAHLAEVLVDCIDIGQRAVVKNPFNMNGMFVPHWPLVDTFVESELNTLAGCESPVAAEDSRTSLRTRNLILAPGEKRALIATDARSVLTCKEGATAYIERDGRYIMRVLQMRPLGRNLRDLALCYEDSQREKSCWDTLNTRPLIHQRAASLSAGYANFTMSSKVGDTTISASQVACASSGPVKTIEFASENVKLVVGITEALGRAN